MGKLKQNAGKQYELSEKEFNYLRLLNIALTYNELKNKCISGYLYQLCHLRFGYAEEQNLQFEIDLEKDKGVLEVKELPDELIENVKRSIDK